VVQVGIELRQRKFDYFHFDKRKILTLVTDTYKNVIIQFPEKHKKTDEK
jgi:hypothetical protein